MNEMNEPLHWNSHELSINKSQRYLINNKCINLKTYDATHQIFVIGAQIFATPLSQETFFCGSFFWWIQEEKRIYFRSEPFARFVSFFSTLTCLRTSRSTFDLFHMNFAFCSDCQSLNAIVFRDWMMLMNSDKNLFLSNRDITMDACVRQQIEQMKWLHCLRSVLPQNCRIVSTSDGKLTFMCFLKINILELFVESSNKANTAISFVTHSSRGSYIQGHRRSLKTKKNVATTIFL